jgi:[ribosomal protein S18]-alanine N-acetyltransferase
MRFAFRLLEHADIETMREWHYPAPYERYDLDADPSDVDEMRAGVGGDRWHAVDDADSGKLVAFFEFVIVGAEVEIGLGLRPDLTGLGLGPPLLEAGMASARDRWQPRRFALDVQPWNERAIRAYEKAGFERDTIYIRTFDGGLQREFLRMSRTA